MLLLSRTCFIALRTITRQVNTLSLPTKTLSTSRRSLPPPLTMKAIVITTPGGPDVLQLQDVADPTIGDNDVLIDVAATALNRADTMQRQGIYQAPSGANPYLGFECSGTVIAVGGSVARWKVGDQVCALLNQGGYAEKVAVPADQVLPVPEGVSLEDAASLPEVACTVWSTVFMTSHLTAGEAFLVHGGSSGIGTFAIQIAKYIGARVFVTAGSDAKLAACKEYGADVCINYKTEDFVERVKEETGGKGVDVILDCIGGSYFQRNLDSLNMDGRLYMIGILGGTKTTVDLSGFLARRLTVQDRLLMQHGLVEVDEVGGMEGRVIDDVTVKAIDGEGNAALDVDGVLCALGDCQPVLDESHHPSPSGDLCETPSHSHAEIRVYPPFVPPARLRNRSSANKAAIVAEVEKYVWPAVAEGKVKPVIYKKFYLGEAAEAHKLIESSAHIGKILLHT